MKVIRLNLPRPSFDASLAQIRRSDEDDYPGDPVMWILGAQRKKDLF